MTATVLGRRTRSAAATAAATAPARRPRPGTDARPARRPELQVVGRRARSPRRLAALAFVAIFGVLFGLVVFNTVLVQNQHHIDDVQRQIREAQALYQSQRLKVAELESPARIVEEATTRLGMVPPPGTTYLTPTPEAAAEVGAAAQPTGSADPSGDSGGWASVKPYLSEQR